ncbi:hypothetical protein HDU98_008453 [Podochytrium sp. JEL0797]|nr:hypothetical protein HDU98_008453 [Podochytrium sp. JEL0797]
MASRLRSYGVWATQGLCVTLLIQKYLGDITMCSGPSMLPTFNPIGDIVLLEFITWRWKRQVSLGDVVVANSPLHLNRVVCKRVLGLPGDTIIKDPSVSNETIVVYPARPCVATDLKLLLGFTSCFFAIGGALYGHFNDFQESKLIVLVCVVVYSILNGAMLGYGMFIEKDVVFVGTRKDPIIRTDPIEKVIVNAKCKKATAEYTVTVHVTGKKELKNTMTKSFGAWFDEDGELVAENLAGDISSLMVDKKSQ